MNLLNSVFILTASFVYVYLIEEYVPVFLRYYNIRFKDYRYLSGGEKKKLPQGSFFHILSKHTH